MNSTNSLPDASLIKFLTTRRSVRRFLKKSVPPETVKLLLEVAMCAPSAHNKQPWRFAVLTGEQVKSKLAVSMGKDFRSDLIADHLEPEEIERRVEDSIHRIQAAPAAVVLCLQKEEFPENVNARRQLAERIMEIQSAALAGGTLLLAAHAKGLGGVWMCAPLFAPEMVQRVLDLPAGWQPQALLLIGYPAESPAERPRRSLEEVARFYG